MQFDAQDYPYASKRHVVYARNGMVCAGNPTATAAGLKTLLKGGNAVDAAKRAADYVTATVDDDGVLRALQHYEVL